MSREVVQWLKKQVVDIQGSCEHKYSVVKHPDLVMSKVEGTYVGAISGPISGKASNLRFELICAGCDLSKSFSASYTCPTCYTPLEKGRCLGARSRERYFGKDYIYYSIIVNRCTNCNFQIASDEWDQ